MVRFLLLLSTPPSPALHKNYSYKKSHGRKFLNELLHKIVADASKVPQHLHRPINQVGLMVLHPPLLAEGLHELVALGEVVTGHHGEEVVVNLVLETAAEPVDEKLGEPVSSSDVAGGGDLELPEVGPGLSVVGSHAVVAKTEDKGEEKAAAAMSEAGGL